MLLKMDFIFVYQEINLASRTPRVSLGSRYAQGMSLSPRAAATRLAILDAATTCFSESGFAATTTREIARRAGVTQPLIHHYFGSKEALFEAVLEASVEDYDQVQAEQWSLPLGDPRFLTRGLVVLFRWLSERPKLMRLAVWARLEGKAQTNPHMLELYGRVRERFEHARQVGLVRSEVDAEVALLMVESLFKGYWDRRELFEALPIDTTDLDERFLRQAIHTLIIGLFEPEGAAEALQLLGTELSGPSSP